MAFTFQPGSLDPLSLENPPPERKQTLACKSKRHAFEIFIKGRREALEDLRFFKSKEGCLHLLFYVSLCLLIVILSLLSATSWRFVDWLDSEACNPDDTFSPFADNSYSYFSMSGFFQVALAFGSLTFTQAKVYDIIWDVVSHISFHRSIIFNLLSFILTCDL